MSISIRLVRFRFFSPYARGLIEARIGLMNPSSGEVDQRDVCGPLPAWCAAVELVGDDAPGGVQPVAQAGDVGGVAALCERRPERGPSERRLDVSEQSVDRVPMLGLLGAELAHQPLQRVAQVPLAHVQLGVGEAGTQRRS